MGRPAKAVTKAKPAIINVAKPAKADPAESTALVPMPNSKALSLDVGMKALNMLSAVVTAEAQIHQLTESNASQRGKAQVLVAMAIHKAALADPSIRLEHCMMKDKTPEKIKLGKQVRLAIGLMVSDGKKVMLTPEAHAAQNAMPGDDADTIKRKKSVRSNFSTMLTKSMRVALHVIETKTKASIDKTGFLKIEGPAVKKIFGDTSVILNEDENQLKDKKGAIVGKLSKLPSFTEITRAVGDAHGVKVVARKDSRTQAVDPMAWLVQTADALVKALASLPDEIPAEVRKALDSLYNALDAKLV